MNLQPFALALALTIAGVSCSPEKDDGADPTPPKGVMLKSVTIGGIPPLDSKGNPWDSDGTGPDLRFVMDDNKGNLLFYSEVVPNADLSKTYTFDFDPDVRIDSIINGQNKWELEDENNLLGPEYMFGNFIYFFDWKYDQDSVMLRPKDPRVMLSVEYVY